MNLTHHFFLMLCVRMLMNLTLCVQMLMNLINHGIVYI